MTTDLHLSTPKKKEIRKKQQTYTNLLRYLFFPFLLNFEKIPTISILGDAEVPPSVYMELLPIERSEYGCLTNYSGEPQDYVNADIHKPREKKLYENVDRAIKFMSWKFK